MTIAVDLGRKATKQTTPPPPPPPKKNIHFSDPPPKKKIIEIQNFEPPKVARATYVLKYQSTPLGMEYRLI